MIKAIIFDYGGVIGNDPSKYIFKAVSKEFGINVKIIKTEFLSFIFLLEKNEILEENFWKKFAQNLNIADHKKLKKIWINEFKKYAKVDKRILLLAKKLKKYYDICILSNNAVFYQKPSIDKLLKKIFSVRIYSFNVGMRKPDPKIYLYTLNKLNRKANECLIVDDGEAKLFYPKKLGMTTIHFISFSQFKKELFEKLNNEKFIII